MTKYKLPYVLAACLLGTTLSVNADRAKERVITIKGVDNTQIRDQKTNPNSVTILLQNMLSLERALAGDHTESEVQEIIINIRGLMPSLKAAGVFEFFPVEEWLNAKMRTGKVFQSRVLVGVLYLEAYPNEVTSKRLHTVKILKRKNLCPDILNELEFVKNMPN